MKYGINIVTLVNNNHSLNQEKGSNERTYGGQTPGSDDLWIFPDADFAKVADSMSCLGLTVTKPSELSGALDQALAAGKPAVIDVKTHLEGIAPRAWTPP
jgi:acetolactate synthase I/II/III large subunit